MADESSNREQLVSAAPIEPVLTQERSFNILVTSPLKAGAQATRLSAAINIATSYKSIFEGMGKVDLVSLEVVYIATAASQQISAGVALAGSARTGEELGMSKGGFMAVSNQMTMGVQHRKVIVVPDTFSRQIQPPSGALPMFDLFIDADKAMNVGLNLEFKFHGFIRKFVTLNF